MVDAHPSDGSRLALPPAKTNNGLERRLLFHDEL
jgi:hypothetical protein